MRIILVIILKYEQGFTSIAYDTAVKLSEQLRIDTELLCDSYANFIIAPYIGDLKTIREESGTR